MRNQSLINQHHLLRDFLINKFRNGQFVHFKDWIDMYQVDYLNSYDYAIEYKRLYSKYYLNNPNRDKSMRTNMAEVNTFGIIDRLIRYQNYKKEKEMTK